MTNQGATMRGTMQDRPLTLITLFEAAERFHGDKSVISAGPTGDRVVSYSAWTDRARRIASALGTLCCIDTGLSTTGSTPEAAASGSSSIHDAAVSPIVTYQGDCTS
jgi:hypothetical protein